jgi:bifunctional DNase/RNase/Cu/Ag efflux protein CusF
LIEMKAVKFRVVGVLFMLVALAACACTQKRAAAPHPGDVRVQVDSIGFDRANGAHYVLLEDGRHRRALPILIDESQARAIALELHGIKPPRPLTQDLMREIIHTTGIKVDRVEIYDVRAGVYYASISLDGGRHRVDARPSDAIALALGVHAPIYVNRKLLEPRSALALGPHSTLPPSARGLGLTVQEMTPTLARYFNLEPGSGLLVSAVDERARAAGIERGDIVTAIGGMSMKRLSDFDRALSRLREGEKVTLNLRRDGGQRSVTLKAFSLDD